jgi:hypothetical protein
MANNHLKTVSLYEDAKAASCSLIHQLAFVFVGFFVMLLVTGGTPSALEIAISFCFCTAFVAWNEQRRIMELRTDFTVVESLNASVESMNEYTIMVDSQDNYMAASDQISDFIIQKGVSIGAGVNKGNVYVNKSQRNSNDFLININSSIFQFEKSAYRIHKIDAVKVVKVQIGFPLLLWRGRLYAILIRFCGEYIVLYKSRDIGKIMEVAREIHKAMPTAKSQTYNIIFSEYENKVN